MTKAATAFLLRDFIKGPFGKAVERVAHSGSAMDARIAESASEGYKERRQNHFFFRLSRIHEIHFLIVESRRL